MKEQDMTPDNHNNEGENQQLNSNTEQGELNMANTINKDDLNATPATLSTLLTKEQLLSNILEAIVQVNFRELAGVEQQGKILNRHYKVITIRVLLATSRDIGFDLCIKHDMSYVFNRAYWMPLDAHWMKTFLGLVAQKMGVPSITAQDADFRDALYKQFLTAGVMQIAESDDKRIMINLQNGTFEFSKNDFRLRAFRAQDFLTYQLPFSYDPNAKAPLFNAYLNKVLPDQQSQKVLAEYCGYLFTSLKLEKALFLYGLGSNGKSVFFEILTAVLGAENCCSYSLSSLTSTVVGYARAMLENKLVNYASEISGNVDVGVLKQLISREKVDARHPYGRPFTMTHYARLIFNLNELPGNVEHTKGFFRRFLIIPFNITIPDHEQDIRLSEKIIATELAGVFNWILDGLKRILDQERFSECHASKAALEEYEIESDSVALYLKDKGYRSSQSNTYMLGTFYQEYQEYCKQDGYHAVSKKKFAKRLIHHKFSIVRRNSGMVVYAENIPAIADNQGEAVQHMKKE